MSGRGRDGGEAPEELAGEDLVALLYGELDADQAARTGARVEADPAQAAQLGEMRRVRELFSAMEDEEPPSRLTAQLMAEAARSAPQTRSAPQAEAGIWARFVSWLQPLVQRPALAAAASLVLVAGVAGVLYMRKGEELTSTTPASTPVRETSTASATGESAAEPPPPATVATPADTADVTVGAQDEGADQAGAEPAKERAPSREVARRKQAPGGQAASEKKAMAYDKAPARPTVKSGTVYGLSEQEMVPREEPAAGDGAAPATGAADQKKADDAPAAEPAPAPQAPPPPADSKTPPRPDAQTLHKRAIDAALDHRCDEVRSLAGQVRAADPSYYAKTFSPDKRLQSCLSGGSTKKATKK